ncbi:MAG: SHOCT domain-containing protein [Thomasclavelia ramosa]
MGFKDKLNNLASSGKEMMANEMAIIKKQKNELSVALTLNEGKEITGNMLSNNVKLWRQSDGLVYFNNRVENLYTIVDYIWDGPIIKTITKSETTGTEKGSSKRKGRGIGAVVGTIVAPGIGTVIGAAHGTGNKKSKKKIQSNTITYDEDIEVDAQARLKLCNVETGEISTIGFLCNSELNSKIINLIPNDFIKNKQIENDGPIDIEVAEVVSDPYEELKKVKELLDMGIISQEEFDAKKKELLGL